MVRHRTPVGLAWLGLVGFGWLFRPWVLTVYFVSSASGLRPLPRKSQPPDDGSVVGVPKHWASVAVFLTVDVS